MGILGHPVDLYDRSLKSSALDNNIDRKKLMIAFDIRQSKRSMQCFFLFWKNKNICILFPIYLDSTFPLHGFRCVGFMMAKMVSWELMDPSIFMKFNSFLTTVSINHPLKNIYFGKVIVFINWYFMSSMSCILEILEI